MLHGSALQSPTYTVLAPLCFIAPRPCFGEVALEHLRKCAGEQVGLDLAVLHSVTNAAEIPVQTVREVVEQLGQAGSKQGVCLALTSSNGGKELLDRARVSLARRLNEEELLGQIVSLESSWSEMQEKVVDEVCTNDCLQRHADLMHSLASLDVRRCSDELLLRRANRLGDSKDSAGRD